MMIVKHVFEVHPDQDAGGYTVIFPFLPGCVTQVEELADLPAAVEEAYELWHDTEQDDDELP